jgi:hypothetical protein
MSLKSDVTGKRVEFILARALRTEPPRATHASEQEGGKIAKR